MYFIGKRKKQFLILLRIKPKRAEQMKQSLMSQIRMKLKIRMTEFTQNIIGKLS